MGDSTKPLQKYAGIGENCNFVIIVNFYPVKGTFCKHSDFKFERKQKQFQYVKDIPKKRIQPCFSEYLLHDEIFFVCVQI